jgi:hypothetical protein
MGSTVQLVRFTPPPAGAEPLQAKNVTVNVNCQSSFVYALLKAGVTYGNESTLPSTFTRFDPEEGPAVIEVTFMQKPLRKSPPLTTLR